LAGQGVGFCIIATHPGFPAFQAGRAGYATGSITNWTFAHQHASTPVLQAHISMPAQGVNQKSRYAQGFAPWGSIILVGKCLEFMTQHAESLQVAGIVVLGVAIDVIYFQLSIQPNDRFAYISQPTIYVFTELQAVFAIFVNAVCISSCTGKPCVFGNNLA
jgi:hypothetical protein